MHISCISLSISRIFKPEADSVRLLLHHRDVHHWLHVIIVIIVVIILVIKIIFVFFVDISSSSLPSLSWPWFVNVRADQSRDAVVSIASHVRDRRPVIKYGCCARARASRDGWCLESPIRADSSQNRSQQKRHALIANMQPGPNTFSGGSDVLPAAIPDFYDVEHLDYAYISRCHDPKELMGLYAVLR